ncbi:sulfotransferase family 2 domain-containing protein [Pelagicoccus sp. SDUM812003]|uniref:sulfotransferase family 2 domain-containing protein n=1 Tax=Pelagicoccus sp. SDUM812003 TaxID=3041267 RepID=UPI00280EFB4E|nr:sulfotransferase family 2 domain-containing protein [Pelagicoccus sp. SDUM812003]MDQ8203607.1 sulfotransferase family 2 domain-containing protein [Pelagicoccus sp. SDUM812003]
MIISNNNRYIFVHIMKAAGTSVTDALSKRLDWRDLALGGTELGEQIHHFYNAHWGVGKHSMAREIKALVGDEVWEDYYTFSFVRHPFPRAVSLYKYIQRFAEQERVPWWKSALRAAAGRKKRFRRNRWLNDLPEAKAYFETSSFSTFIRRAHEVGALGMKPQVDWVTDEEGNDMLDFVGKVENLEADFERIVQSVGLEGVQLSRANKSTYQKPWYEYFADETDFQFLSEVFSEDFVHFGYDASRRR